MKLQSFWLAATAGLVSQLVSAASFPNSSREFYLRTDVVSGTSKFANLYPSSYHTGAGQSIPALQADKKSSVKSYFNGTRLNVDLGSDFPWGWVPGYLTYAAWAPVEINGGIGSEGFKIDKTAGVVWQGNDWVACDWTYGVPQVFYYSSYHKTKLPCSCAKIRLIPEYI